MKLTDKQEMFCREYMVDFNATQAAIRAGYSKKTAQEIGYENMTKPLIVDRMASLKAKHIEKITITVDEVIGYLQKSLKVNGATKFDAEGNECLISETGFNKAIDMAGKFNALWIEKKEVNHSGVEDSILALMKKKEE